MGTCFCVYPEKAMLELQHNQWVTTAHFYGRRNQSSEEEFEPNCTQVLAAECPLSVAPEIRVVVARRASVSQHGWTQPWPASALGHQHPGGPKACLLSKGGFQILCHQSAKPLLLMWAIQVKCILDTHLFFRRTRWIGSFDWMPSWESLSWLLSGQQRLSFIFLAFIEVQKQGWEWHSKTLWRKGYGKRHCAWSTLECKVGSFQNSVRKLFLRLLDHDQLQDKPYWYTVPLGRWYEKQTQGSSTNWKKYEGDIWSSSRWGTRGRKQQPLSARTQRVSTRRTSSTSQLTSRWTSWVFVFSCKDLFENAYRWSGCC